MIQFVPSKIVFKDVRQIFSDVWSEGKSLIVIVERTLLYSNSLQAMNANFASAASSTGSGLGHVPSVTARYNEQNQNSKTMQKNEVKIPN